MSWGLCCDTSREFLRKGGWLRREGKGIGRFFAYGKRVAGLGFRCGIGDSVSQRLRGLHLFRLMLVV